MKTEQAPRPYTEEEVDEVVRREIHQERELLAQVLRGMPDLDVATRQDWIGNPALLQEALAGLALSPFIVKVDRLVKPVYPDWVEKALHPELENIGPGEFNLAKDVSLWLHEGQQSGGVTTGNPIYKFLRDNDLLSTCLNLQDGLAIQKKGIAVFQKLFEGKSVFLWKSVARRCLGDLLVPYLCGVCGWVVVRWARLGDDFRGCDFAARFASPPATTAS